MRALTTVVTALLAVLVGGAPASAAEAGSCLTTYEAAIIRDVTVNGPVHGLVIGDFTPGIFLNGATGPTSAYVACTV